MSSKSRGTQRERAVKDWLAKRDWMAFRAPGSLGAADIVALKANERPLLVQVKSDVAGPFAHFGPADRKALLLLAEMAGGVAWLVWWPPRAKPMWIGEGQWPKARVAA